MKTILLSLAILFAIGLSAQTPATIYEIQGQADASPLIGQIIQTTGIITTLNRDDGFYLQDGTTGWNGVVVYYDGETWTGGTFNVGDAVTVIGKVDEYYEKTEITDVVSVEVNSSGNIVPAAILLATGSVADEQYEGMLVKCEDAVCTDTTSAVGGHGMIMFNDGSGDVIIDDNIWSYWTDSEPMPDSTYQITGVVDYDFGDYKILPRDINDFVIGALGIYDSHIQGLEIFPNPVSDNVVYVTADANISSVSIFNMVGQNVRNIQGINSNQTSIKIADLKQGMYILKIETINGKTNTHKITVK
jgi:uncharacterized protein YdeI (BOF family)